MEAVDWEPHLPQLHLRNLPFMMIIYRLAITHCYQLTSGDLYVKKLFW